MTEANYVTLVLDLYDGGGSQVVRGAAALTPSLQLTDVPDQQLITGAPLPAVFGSYGLPKVKLLAPDSPGPQPEGFAWQVAYTGVPGNPATVLVQPFAGPAAFTATDAAPCVFTWTPTSYLKSLPDGTGVQLAGDSLPSGFTAGTTYYVVNASGFTAGLAATAGGSPIASTSAGSGELTVVQYNLSALTPAEAGTAYTGYLPLPSGTPSAGQVPIASGSGEASAWGTPAGGGTVTSASVVTANGFAGTVANPATTPAVTLETTVTGVLKGNGTAIEPAAAGTDYLAPDGSGAALTGITPAQVGADAAGLAALAQSNAEAASVPRSGGTMTGELSPAVAALTFGSSIPVNAALGNVFAVTLTASTGTLANPANPVDGQLIRVRVTQDATGGRTLAYGTAYDWGAAGAPVLSTAASKVDILVFEYNAALGKWCGSAALGF